MSDKGIASSKVVGLLISDNKKKRQADLHDLLKGK
jgi:hypothetical protein